LNLEEEEFITEGELKLPPSIHQPITWNLYQWAATHNIIIDRYWRAYHQGAHLNLEPHQGEDLDPISHGGAIH